MASQSSARSSRNMPSSAPRTAPPASSGAITACARSAPARNQRVCGESSACTTPWNRPAGCPSLRRPPCRSALDHMASTCRGQPARAPAAAPARPAPTMTTDRCRDARSAVPAGIGGAMVRRVATRSASRACDRSPPGAATVKPAAARRVAHHARGAPGGGRRARRGQAAEPLAARAVATSPGSSPARSRRGRTHRRSAIHFGSQVARSPKASSRCTRPPSKSSRCRSGVSGGQAATSSRASAGSALCACARAQVVERAADACRATGTTAARSAAPSSRHAAQVARKLLPRPKPVSSTTKRSRPRQRCGRPLPAEEDVARLLQSAAARVVDIVEIGRERRCRVVEVDARRHDRRCLHAAWPAAVRAKGAPQAPAATAPSASDALAVLARCGCRSRPCRRSATNSGTAISKPVRELGGLQHLARRVALDGRLGVR